MTVPMADLAAQYRALQTQIDAAVSEILSSGGFILGPTVAAFERDVAAACGATHGIGVGNGTDALLLSLMALGVGPGDEVITPPFTFVATVETVALLGAVPVFADIDPITFNIDPEQVAKKLTPKTRAIVPVHLFGQLADMTRLSSLAADHRVPLLGDGAQAIGSTHAGQGVASWAALTTLSFYPTKNLGAAGDGGMVLTSDDALAERLRLLRFHGSGGGYDYRAVGVCSRLDALQAAILAVKLPHLDGYNAARRANASFYDAALAGIDGLILPHCVPGNIHTYHQYTVRVTGGRRDALKAFLAAQGIASGVFYPQALHLAPAYAALGNRAGDFPEAERACAEVLSLPVFPELAAQARDRVATAVRTFFDEEN
jgi:dTDP-4-amino-4,6-dideoxygalactose transaminase